MDGDGEIAFSYEALTLLFIREPCNVSADVLMRSGDVIVFRPPFPNELHFK